MLEIFRFTALVAIMLTSVVAQDALPKFEVASVKPDTFVPSSGHGRELRVDCSNGRFTSRNASVWYLIKWAWNIEGDNDRLVGHPNWTNSTYYEVDAKADAPVPEAQCRLMVRSLLIDRFGLRSHLETRTLDALDLVIAKGGPTIQAVTDPEAPVNGPGFTVGGGSIQMIDPKAKGWTMQQLADCLGFGITHLEKKVFDRTGLEGIYRIDLRFRRWNDEDSLDPEITSALKLQLGLELRPAKEPLEVLVVDGIERPSANQ